MPENQVAEQQMFVTVALNAWEQWLGRLGKLFASISDEQMMTPLALGKNRPVYLFGHLIAVNEALIPQLRLGEPTHPEYREIFITQRDGAVTELPSISELRQSWTDVHASLAEHLNTLTPSQWIERHASVSEEDFAKEPHRNRMALLHSRTAHLGYHLGQLMLYKSQWTPAD